MRVRSTRMLDPYGRPRYPRHLSDRAGAVSACLVRRRRAICRSAGLISA